jgi:hypothetical protein
MVGAPVEDTISIMHVITHGVPQAWVGITGQGEADVPVILVEESNASDSIRMGLE